MNNRLWNCKNPHQGDSKKVLCVCSAGLLRSPTAAKVLWKEYGYNTRACGLDVGHALIPIDEVLVRWADEIICMSQVQQSLIISQFDPQVPVINLRIQDSFAYMDSRLIKEILDSYRKEMFDSK